MRKPLRIVLWISVGGLVLLLVTLAMLYQATQTVPEAYEQALEIDPATLRQGSDELLRRASALASDVQREGQWEAWFTEEQINGWLAVDLPENHPDTLPGWVRDPRVAIDDGRVALFCAVERDDRRSVLTLHIEPYMAEPNVVALRLLGARAGVLPLPLGRVTEQVTQGARDAQLRVQWQQAGGDPVALVHVPELETDDEKSLRVERVEVSQGQIYVAGTTGDAAE
jgi:hypothetical protein